MNQNIWGPNLWFSLHTITMNYPNQPTFLQQKDYKNFFTSLQYVIPCKICRKNYQRHLIEHPIDNFLHSRKALVFWLIDIHNMVNSETGKKVLPHDKVIKKYEKIYDKKIFDIYDETEILKKMNKNNKIIYISLLFILVIIACLYFNYK
jgi:hypothetical protein